MNSAAVMSSDSQALASAETDFSEAREQFEALIAWAQEASGTLSDVEVGAEKRGPGALSEKSRLLLTRSSPVNHCDSYPRRITSRESPAACCSRA